MSENSELRWALQGASAHRLAELRRWDCVSQPPSWIYAISDDHMDHLLLWAMALFDHATSGLAQQMAAHDKGGMMSLRLERLLSADMAYEDGRAEYCRTLKALHGLGCRAMGMAQVRALLHGDMQAKAAISAQYYSALRQQP